MSSPVVSREDASTLSLRGAVHLKGVFSPHWVDVVAAGIARSVREPSGHSQSLRGGGQGAYFNDYFNWRRIPEFQDLVHNSPAGEIAARVMGLKQRYGRNLSIRWNTFCYLYKHMYYIDLVLQAYSTTSTC